MGNKISILNNIVFRTDKEFLSVLVDEVNVDEVNDIMI